MFVNANQSKKAVKMDVVKRKKWWQIVLMDVVVQNQKTSSRNKNMVTATVTATIMDMDMDMDMDMVVPNQHLKVNVPKDVALLNLNLLLLQKKNVPKDVAPPNLNLLLLQKKNVPKDVVLQQLSPKHLLLVLHLL